MGFWEASLRVMEALGVECSGALTTQVVEVDENGEGVVRKAESDTFTILHECFRQV